MEENEEIQGPGFALISTEMPLPNALELPGEMPFMPLPPLSQAIKIFFSYAVASPADKNMFDKLVKHLSMLRRQQLIDQWYDSAISAGSDISQTIKAHLQEAQIIVLLLSAEFIASDRCYEQEMQLALALSHAGNARLIPVILFPSEWKMLPLHGYSPLPPNGKAVSRWRDREEALLEVARGIRKVVEELTDQAIRILAHSVPPKLPLHTFPYRQNIFFTDRETILSALSAFFSSTQHPQTRILALNGLGGMGKTQIALEYLYRSSQHYQTILWLNASSREILSSEVNVLAEKLALPRKERANEEHLFTALKRWLQNQTDWILVLDHIDDINLTDILIPPQSNGHVLLTTRTQAVGEIPSVISITSMDTPASVLFLLQRAKIIPVGTALDQAPLEARQQAEAIAQALDGFPLALDQAGAYIEETGRGLDFYLALFQQERAALLGRRGRLTQKQNHPDSVVITLKLTIEEVQLQRATNLHLLLLLAFLHPEDIPNELLADGADELSEPLRSLVANPLVLGEALADLRGYSLIQHLADTTTFCMHRMVQAVLMDTLTKRQQRQWASQVVRMVNRVFPEVVFNNWTTCERYRAQAQQCATLIATFKLTLKDGALLLRRLGSYCYRQACYVEAEIYLTQALNLHKQKQWSDAQEMGQTLNALALLYYRQARFLEAEQTHLHALSVREQIFGPDHPATAESLHNLALLYEQQGNYQQAEQFYQRVLTIEEHILGPDHLDTAKTLNNLGLLYFDQGKYQQAETAYRHALAIYNSLPSNHPDMLHSLDGLGALAEARGNFQQAEEFYQRALTICQQVFEETHPETAHTLNKLADIYEVWDKDQQAEEFYQRALTIGERTLGPEHPDVALFLNNLAYLADKQGKHQRAEQYYQRALTIYEQALGEAHPRVADVLNNLGELSRTMHEEEYAEILLRRSLAIREQILGPTHPDTAQSMSNLASLLVARHEYEDAEMLFQRAFTIRLQTFGPTHPTTEQTREKYVSLLEQLGRSAEATTLRQTAHIPADEETDEQAKNNA